MNERQRILSAIDHIEPDLVPIDLGATPSSGISAIAYRRLTEHLGFPDDTPRVYDVVQQLAEPSDALLDLFGIDVIDIGRWYDRNSTDWHEVRLADGTRALYPTWFRPVRRDDGSYQTVDGDGDVLARMPAGGTFFDQNYFPYLDGYPPGLNDLDRAMGKVLWGVYAQAPWSHAGEPDFLSDLRRAAIELREASDRAIVIGVGCNLFEWGTFLRRMDNFLMDLVLDPTGVEALVDSLLERHLATLARVCEAVGDVVDIVKFGDDLGTDQGPFMQPDIYRQIFKPRHTELCRYVKSHSSMRTMLHSCGSISALIPDLIEAGFEILNPVQINARNMDPGYLKREFGSEICFWGGGIDTRSVLNRGSEDEIRRSVLGNLETFSRGGGYVFNTVHNILHDVSPSHIVTMINAFREFNGRAPIG